MKKIINRYMFDLLSTGVELNFTNHAYTLKLNEFDKFEILNEYGETVKQYKDYSRAEEFILNN